ncbi:MAG: hypothetical protein F4129_00155 [Acidimicrobiia bacterium]|nr:hypothetical protein [Acidimicrobiia bacterium]MYG58603.1 hypothetical protein [Acidimicrobiia bacterium]MYH94899.1 hypothetical protein [Acidimicrobiia bacterium]MYJ34119.1 hypothetical protein [Acidimicrobiia bacterium]MYL10376.1 hypothetical protein [Acidimicrobiia bacterium]
MGSGKHKGGWSEPVHGTDQDGRELTASFGWGTKTGHTLIADGHVEPSVFIQSDNHDHANGKGGYNDRGKYSGSGGGS